MLESVYVIAHGPDHPNHTEPPLLAELFNITSELNNAKQLILHLIAIICINFSKRHRKSVQICYLLPNPKERPAT